MRTSIVIGRPLAAAGRRDSAAPTNLFEKLFSSLWLILIQHVYARGQLSRTFSISVKHAWEWSLLMVMLMVMLMVFGVNSQILPLYLKGRFYAINAFRHKGKILCHHSRSVPKRNIYAKNFSTQGLNLSAHSLVCNQCKGKILCQLNFWDIITRVLPPPLMWDIYITFYANYMADVKSSQYVIYPTSGEGVGPY